MACSTCGFELWLPISKLEVSTAGLYDDARFPGRTIVSLNEHQEHLEDLSSELLLQFMMDVQDTVWAIKAATSVERVNVAILGNAVSHVHAHLIPRYPEVEAKPQNSPWDDPRIKEKMDTEVKLEFIQKIRNKLQS